MGYRQILRKELQDAIRRRYLPILVVLFVLVGALIGYTIDGSVAAPVLLAVSFLGPLVAVSFTQQSIAGKRENNEMAVLLGLPFSRGDVVLGSYLGQFALVGSAVLSTYAGAVVVGGLTGGPLSPGSLLWGLVMALLLSAIFVSITLGISAATASTTVASAGGFLVFFLFAFQLWGVLPSAVLYLINGFSMPSTEPVWADVFRQLSPYATVRNALVPVATDITKQVPLAGSTATDDLPLYMSVWVAAPATLTWVVAPAVLGYLRFQRVDI
jgi:ABC-2 type transport system permease protein